MAVNLFINFVYTCTSDVVDVPGTKHILTAVCMYMYNVQCIMYQSTFRISGFNFHHVVFSLTEYLESCQFAIKDVLVTHKLPAETFYIHDFPGNRQWFKGTMINRAWNRRPSFRLTQWLKIIPHMIRSYYRCCCINEPLIFSHLVHLKLHVGHWFHALLEVCSDCDDTVPFINTWFTLTLTTPTAGFVVFWWAQYCSPDRDTLHGARCPKSI